MATTELIPAYGGIQRSREELEAIAQVLRSQSIPARLFHDAREPLYVDNVDAGVQERADGEYELWIEFDAEEEGWAKYEAERDALGVPGGISFTLAETFAELESRTGPGPVSVAVAADAHHFSDDQILAAAAEFSGASSVKVSRLKQFSAVPTALVLIQFVLQEGAQIPPGLISAWLYDALRHFRRPEQPHPAVTLEYSEGAEGRKVTATIAEGVDASVAERAMATFESVANQPGMYECTPDGNWRAIRNRKET